MRNTKLIGANSQGQGAGLALPPIKLKIRSHGVLELAMQSLQSAGPKGRIWCR